MAEIKKTRRTQLTWNQSLKGRVDEIKTQVKRASGKSMNNLEVFMLCLAVGFNERKKNDVPKRTSDVAHVSTIKGADYATIRAVAVYETGSSEVLMDEDAVFDIAEQYASGGLEFLVDKMDSVGSVAEWLEQYLWRRRDKGDAAKAG
jgi:hypothetical protein